MTQMLKLGDKKFKTAINTYDCEFKVKYKHNAHTTLKWEISAEK